MGAFVPCAGKTACTEDATHCRGCGRSHEEIARARDAIAALADLAVEMDYTNLEDYAAYVAARIVRKVEHQRAAAAMAGA